jgi:hypothetical protein
MTNTTKAVSTVIKTDGVGRVQTPATRREALLDEFERSGLSGAKFAALVGIKYSTFATWAQRRRQRGTSQVPAKPGNPMQWLEAVVEQAHHPGGQSPSALVLQLPGGVRVEVVDEKQAALAAVMLKALAKSC